MNIIVPINVECVRVSPSTHQKTQRGLYDFSKLGNSPVSANSGLVAAENFEEQFQNMSDEYGIHIHWSIPRCYTKGIQNAETGALEFPVLPNRWLIIRYFKELNKNTRSGLRAWIIESDAHSADQSIVNSITTIPWMDNEKDLYGLKGPNYLGRKILPTESEPWVESTTQKGFLGAMFQAPLAYGETFSPYYPNCKDVFGFYDKLEDYYAKNELTIDCDFEVSYQVIGWINNFSADLCNQTLQKIANSYNEQPEPQMSFPDYLKDQLPLLLNWCLDDYEGYTPTNVSTSQSVFNGLIANINWKVKNQFPDYPTPSPSAETIKVSVGNTTAEALSAFINHQKGGPNDQQDPSNVSDNYEWLLNALQSGKLQDLGTGASGVGQLDEYLHDLQFASLSAGYLWDLKASDAVVGSLVNNGLAICLNNLNLAQRNHYRNLDDLKSRRKKLIFDWSYHIKVGYEDHIINGDDSPDRDNSKDYLVDGLLHLFPAMLEAGNFTDNYKPNANTIYTSEPFKIQDTNTLSQLSTYTFNQQKNSVAESFLRSILNFQFDMIEIIPSGIVSLIKSIRLVQNELLHYDKNAINAEDALKVVKNKVDFASTESSKLNTIANALISPDGGILMLLSKVKNTKDTIDRHLSVTGPFKTSLAVDSQSSLPLKPESSYQGQMKTKESFDNVGQWDKTELFIGIKDLIDQFCGVGNYSPLIVDTSQSALSLSSAYCWRKSGQNVINSVAYYVQLSEYNLKTSATTAEYIINALEKINSNLNSSDIKTIIETLGLISNTTLPAVVNLLNNPTDQNVKEAISKLSSLEGTLLSINEVMSKPIWKETTMSFEYCLKQGLSHLPTAHQVDILKQFLNEKMDHSFSLESIPMSPYQQPNDPIILLGDDDPSSELLKPVTRNGNARNLPCRVNSELVGTNAPITYPQLISDLKKLVIPGSNTLSESLELLAKEGFLLTPYLQNIHTTATLQTAAIDNKHSQEKKATGLVLNPAPSELSGKLSYYIAYNWHGGKDVFMPLYIYWEAEYTFTSSTQYYSSPTYNKDFLNQFVLDEYMVDYQVKQDNLSNFINKPQKPNAFALSGVISLSSSSTANLCYQIQKYCIDFLNFDPAKGPPENPTEERKKLYETYVYYQTTHVLSQGLSGYNNGLIQRFLELQLPINIPPNWMQREGGKLDEIDVWATSFLQKQSLSDKNSWAEESVEFKNINEVGHFQPFRAGFTNISNLYLVDVFGRKVTIDSSSPITSETMAVPNPHVNGLSPIYLPPRYIQPSRLQFHWLPANQLLSEITELSFHPAASPICGWFLPNHLDDLLMVYNENGEALGSLGYKDQALHWFTLPGENFDPKSSNIEIMKKSLTEKGANPELEKILVLFLYPDNSGDTTSNFRTFQNVVDKAQQFIISPGQQEDQGLALLVGRPLAIGRARLSVEHRGKPEVSLDKDTFIPWDSYSNSFRMDSVAFRPYNFENFNQASVPEIEIPIKLGRTAIRRGESIIPYFNDGMVGFFHEEMYDKFYTPVENENSIRISSTFGLTPPTSLSTGGKSELTTFIFDPQAPIHATSGVLPVKSLAVSPDQYQEVLNKLMMIFLTSPVLLADQIEIPTPSQEKYDWFWTQLGKNEEMVKTFQIGTDVSFSVNPQVIVDGWLKLNQKT